MTHIQDITTQLHREFQKRGSMTEQAAELFLKRKGLADSDVQSVLRHGEESKFWRRKHHSLLPLIDESTPEASSAPKAEDLIGILKEQGGMYLKGAVAALMDMGLAEGEAHEVIDKAIELGQINKHAHMLVATESESSSTRELGVLGERKESSKQRSPMSTKAKGKGKRGGKRKSRVVGRRPVKKATRTRKVKAAPRKPARKPRPKKTAAAAPPKKPSRKYRARSTKAAATRKSKPKSSPATRAASSVVVNVPAASAASATKPKSPPRRRRKRRVPAGTYRNARSGTAITIKRIRTRENPALTTKETLVAGTALAAGMMLSDMVDRAVATRPPAGQQEPLYGAQAAAAVRAKSDGLRLGVQLAGAASLGAAAYYAGNRNRAASIGLSGLSAGFFVKFLTKVLSDYAMPALFKVTASSERTLANRLYADSQTASGGLSPALPPGPTQTSMVTEYAGSSGQNAGWPGMVGSMLLPPGAFQHRPAEGAQDYGPVAAGSVGSGCSTRGNCSADYNDWWSHLGCGNKPQSSYDTPQSAGSSMPSPESATTPNAPMIRPSTADRPRFSDLIRTLNRDRARVAVPYALRVNRSSDAR